LSIRPTITIIFGIHQQIGRSFPARFDSLIELATDPFAASSRAQRRAFALDNWCTPRPATELSADSSRYYFHIDNGTRYADETGSVHSTQDQAAAHALAIARGRPIARVQIGR